MGTSGWTSSPKYIKNFKIPSYLSALICKQVAGMIGETFWNTNLGYHRFHKMKLVLKHSIYVGHLVHFQSINMSPWEWPSCPKYINNFKDLSYFVFRNHQPILSYWKMFPPVLSPSSPQITSYPKILWQLNTYVPKWTFLSPETKFDQDNSLAENEHICPFLSPPHPWPKFTDGIFRMH